MTARAAGVSPPFSPHGSLCGWHLLCRGSYTSVLAFSARDCSDFESTLPWRPPVDFAADACRSATSDASDSIESATVAVVSCRLLGPAFAVETFNSEGGANHAFVVNSWLRRWSTNGPMWLTPWLTVVTPPANGWLAGGSLLVNCWLTWVQNGQCWLMLVNGG